MRPSFALLIGLVIGYFLARVVFSFQEFSINQEILEKYRESRRELTTCEHSYNVLQSVYQRECK